MGVFTVADRAIALQGNRIDTGVAMLVVIDELEVKLQLRSRS